jgi:hypothetical protein
MELCDSPYSPPHLVQHGNQKRCSACNHPFALDVKPSLSRAFRQHVEEMHRTKIAADDGRRLTVGFAAKK